jgi:hemerythrin
LEETQYSALGTHRLQHREFVKKVEQFQRDLKAGAVGRSVAVTVFLKDWLINQIQPTAPRVFHSPQRKRLVLSAVTGRTFLSDGKLR